MARSRPPAVRRRSCERRRPSSRARCRRAQHPAVGLLQLDELAPAQLGTLAVGLDELLHEGPQRVGVAPLVADVDVVGPVATRSGSLDQPSRGARSRSRRCGPATTAWACARPSGPGVEVLAHADLLAVVQRRGAGKREEQAVDHPDAPRVTVEHGWEPALEAPAVDLHRRARGRGRRRPLRAPRRSACRASARRGCGRTSPTGSPDGSPGVAERLGQRPGVLPRASERYIACMAMKSNIMCSSSP